LLTASSSLAATARKKSSPCKDSLEECPDQGCGQAGTTDALINEIKHHAPVGNEVTLITFDDLRKFQEQADKLFKPKQSLTKKDRTSLRKLHASASTAVGEGSLVQVIGYLVGTPHANVGGESVNCRLKGPDNNDYHITIAPADGDTEFDGVVVEMIPQHRPSGWTLTKLRRLTTDHIPVLVQGQLLYDNKHVVNDDPDNVLNGQPKRMSLWEVHPITGFFACVESKTCDEEQLSEWTALDDVSEPGKKQSTHEATKSGGEK
jgi:hypothetical protein